MVFADYDVRQVQLQEALSRLRTEVEERLGSLALLKFADFPEVDDGSTSLLGLRRENVMNSDEFDAYRERAL